MLKSQKAYNWFVVFCMVAGAVLIFVLPGFIVPSDFDTAEATFRAIASQSVHTGAAYAAFLVQLAGAVIWLPGFFGVMRWLQQRERAGFGKILGGALGSIGALSVMPVIGLELAQTYILANGTDKDVMVSLALGLNQWSVFGTFLIVGLAGLWLGTLVLGASVLWVKFRP